MEVEFVKKIYFIKASKSVLPTVCLMWKCYRKQSKTIFEPPTSNAGPRSNVSAFLNVTSSCVEKLALVKVLVYAFWRFLSPVCFLFFCPYFLSLARRRKFRPGFLMCFFCALHVSRVSLWSCFFINIQ